MNSNAGNTEEENLRAVKAIASRFSNRGFEQDELIQAGYVGLLKAAKNFDDKRGIPFISYAFHYIEGEMRHYIQNESLIRIPSEKQRKAAEIYNAIQCAETLSGIGLRFSDAAKQLGLNEQLASEILLWNERCRYIAPLDSVKSESCTIKEKFEEQAITKSILKEALLTLTPFEQKVITLRFFEYKTQKKCAETLKTSQSNISKTEKRALHKLYVYLDQ